MEHIEFTRVDLSPTERRKRPGFGPNFVRKNHQSHGTELRTRLLEEIHDTKEKAREFRFSPYLVVKIELEDGVTLDENNQNKLEAYGLKVINVENKELMVLFSEDLELTSFQRAIEDYRNGVIAKTRIVNEDLLSMIKRISRWSNEDRKGNNLEGIIGIDYFDCYLWVFDTVDESIKKAREFEENMRVSGIRVCDKFVSSSVSIVRIHMSSDELKTILEHVLVYKVDTIPKYQIARTRIKDIGNVTIDQIPFDNSQLDPDNSPSICVIDSGVFKGHPLFEGVVGDSQIYYQTNGYEASDMDISGHGTAVSSICIYGDFSVGKEFVPEIYLLSAKIHDGQYIGEANLCIDDLKERGFVFNFEHEEFIFDFFQQGLDIGSLIKNIGLADHQEEFTSVLIKYLHLYETLIPNQMIKIVDYFYHTHGCRIFNLSQGDLNKEYDDWKPRAWTCILDEIQNQMDVLFVISSGNYYYDSEHDTETVHENYPKYFYKESKSRIIDPANSITSITVGGLATSGIPYNNQDKDINVVPITSSNQISSITRLGPGINGSIKPEFVAYSGDWGLHTLSNNLVSNRGLNKVLFNNKPLDAIFSFNFGTSFAAPYVSHLAAQILIKYKDVSNNLIRALIASSATIPISFMQLLNEKICSQKNNMSEFYDKFKNNISGEEKFAINKMVHYSVGYGFPNLKKCIDSEENRTVLFADMKSDEDSITPDTIHIFEIPIPTEFRNASGQKRIIVSLAFNPEVRKTRIDYSGKEMRFELIRGKSIQEVSDVFSTQAGKLDAEKLAMVEGKFKCSMEPGVELRSKGTLQQATFFFTSAKEAEKYGDNYYLVVSCKRNWSSIQQKYAVVVVLETDDNVQIYNVIKAKVRVPLRTRVRQ